MVTWIDKIRAEWVNCHEVAMSHCTSLKLCYVAHMGRLYVKVWPQHWFFFFFFFLYFKDVPQLFVRNLAAQASWLQQ